MTFPVPVPISPRTGAAAEAVASVEPYVRVIEDEPQAATLLTRYVRSVGLAAEHARDAREALAIIARQRPAGITVDTTLPGIDGWGLLTRLRGDPATATIPVVVISVEDDAAQSVALGASEHLVKPVARSVLADALERARVPIHRVAGLRVAIARTARPKLDAVASALREAGCVLEPVAVGGAVPDAIDVAIVDPALEAVASAFEARGVPILDLARVEADVDARERLIRQVRLAADRRRR
jgi:CheY-like chemotaxis protein